jgi:peptide/nickel transport system substrate-binding protein
MKRAVLSLLAALALGSLGSRVAADSERINATTIPHVLRYATAEDVQGLNPELNSQAPVAWLSQMTMAYLFRYDHQNRIVPELATTIPTLANGGISRDGLTITLHLRPGVKWSDGEPFDADDVIFSINAMNNSANNVVGRDGFDRVTRLDEPNKYTVVVHLRETYGEIVPTLFSSSGGTAVLPKHLLGSLPDINKAPYNDLPVGIGPFRYAAWKRGDAVELEANPYYWRGRPKLERVIMKIIPDRNTVLTQLQTGEIDMWFPFGGVYLSRVQAIPSVYVLRMPAYAYNEIALNVKNPALADRTVRQALRLATDRKALRDKIGHGVGILQDVAAPTVDPAVPKDIPFVEYDPGNANALLDRDGWVRGPDGIRAKNGTRLSFDVATSSGTPDVDIQIELIRTWWKAIGVELNVQHYQAAMMFAPYSDGGILYSGKFDVAFLGWFTPVPIDPFNLYSCKMFPPAGQNVGHYCDPKVDALLAEMRSTYDYDRYKTDLGKVLRQMSDDVPVIVQTGRENIFGINKDLKNFDPNDVSLFDDMMNVDI